MSCLLVVCFTSVLTIIGICEASRILAYYPTPSLSHQVVFRPLSLELAKRGHEVVVITPDPIFPNGTAPENLAEIDVHDLSYNTWREVIRANKNKLVFNLSILKLMITLLEEQINTKAVQKILKDPRPFDLIIVEALAFPLGLSHIHKAPIIQFSSLAGSTILYQVFGATTHPILYPTTLHQRIYNHTLREKLNVLYDEYVYNALFREIEGLTSDAMKRVFGPDVPTVRELRKNVDMYFLNVHPLWDFNRPVPPNVVYLGGMHQKPAKDLPKSLQNYLDSSKNGVVYVSFGSNVEPALFSPEKIQTLVNVFSKLPYNILWKWNQDELPGRTPNIRISKWFPQSDLLRHPKIKLFVTQCGLQSTDEAITAGVPLLGMPVFGDQEFNAEQYLHYGIGVRVDLETVTEDKLNEGINKILKDDTYRNNIVRLRTIMRDQPQTPLERAVWWTEYTIRHSGARHLRTPAANISLAEYYELELVITVLFVVGLALGVVIGVLRYTYVKLFRVTFKVKKN
ncbi:UDP-glucuronosyltransferase 2B14-like [Ostrinia furnacalis]|uniref:UDP-glucuronosyltransferase 2B14-like n=1 Tax=Ostrinia furnacalis TaxID=93504 RepID=UPI00103C9512|nr:UDP-glucuronosyltransferase 2B14-like [Ostrinia furnacalis]